MGESFDFTKILTEILGMAGDGTGNEPGKEPRAPKDDPTRNASAEREARAQSEDFKRAARDAVIAGAGVEAGTRAGESGRTRGERQRMQSEARKQGTTRKRLESRQSRPTGRVRADQPRPTVDRVVQRGTPPAGVRAPRPATVGRPPAVHPTPRGSPIVSGGIRGRIRRAVGTVTSPIGPVPGLPGPVSRGLGSRSPFDFATFGASVFGPMLLGSGGSSAATPQIPSSAPMDRGRDRERTSGQGRRRTRVTRTRTLGRANLGTTSLLGRAATS